MIYIESYSRKYLSVKNLLSYKVTFDFFIECFLIDLSGNPNQLRGATCPDRNSNPDSGERQCAVSSVLQA